MYAVTNENGGRTMRNREYRKTRSTSARKCVSRVVHSLHGMGRETRIRGEHVNFRGEIMPRESETAVLSRALGSE